VLINHKYIRSITIEKIQLNQYFAINLNVFTTRET